MTTLKGSTALVTGATGFLGGALARRLAAEGVRVKALARRPNRDRHLQGVANIEIVSGDILDAARMHEVTQGCDYVFHVAAALEGTVAKQRPINVDGTRHVMQAAEAAQVQRVVHVSSLAIYGFGHTTDVYEDTPPKPCRVPYNMTKLEGESALVLAAKNVPYTIIRPAMIYGPRSALWMNTMFRLAKRKPTPFIGDGSGTTHPIYVEDVVEMMLLLANHPQAVGEAFNCAPDPAPTWREFLGGYAALAGHQRWLALPVPLMRVVALLIEAGLTLRGEPQETPQLIDFITSHITYKMTKARDLLGWQPKVSLKEGTQLCIPYLQEKGLLPKRNE